MIGIFGQFNILTKKNANIKGMQKRVPNRLKSIHFDYKNFSSCLVNHSFDEVASFYETKEAVAIFIGEIYNINKSYKNNIAQYFFDIVKRRDYGNLPNLNGLFCAVVFRKIDNSLTFISDRLASWPLFIHKTNHSYFFSNNLYILLGHEEISPKVNKQSLVQLFTLQRTFGANSNLEDIEFFPPATILTLGQEKIMKKKYWELDFKKAFLKRKEVAFVLAETLKKVMSYQAEGGLLLSGGLDSRLLLAATLEQSLTCWTSASYNKNPELKIARTASKLANMNHNELIVDPPSILNFMEGTVMANNGIYPASTLMSSFLPRIDKKNKILLTGHGLDYTFRGYYLPARFLDLLGTSTRIPLMKNFKNNYSGKVVLENLRQGPPLNTVKRILGGDNLFLEHKIQLAKDLEHYLSHWLNSEFPENAWDAFIMNSVSQHYAFTSMMAIRDESVLRIPAFDNNILDIYLSMPPNWRISSDIAIKTLRILSPKLAKLKNANTLISADINPFLEVFYLIIRGGLRKFGLFTPPQIPTKMHSIGSWQNLSMLFRVDNEHKKKLNEIKNRLDWLSCGVLSPDELKKCIDEHINFKQDHTKLLRQLLTHDAWMHLVFK